VAIATNGSGYGAAIGANYIANDVTATVDAATAKSSAGSVTIGATENGDIEALSVGLEGADQNAAGGSISIAVITDDVTASIAGAATGMAADDVDVTGTNSAKVVATAGQVAIGGEVGVGISVTTLVVDNKNYAFISGTADVSGIQGVDTNAVTDDTGLTALAIGGAVGGSDTGAAGSASVVAIDDTTLAYIDSPVRRPPQTPGSPPAPDRERPATSRSRHPIR
jgi:hypothetical protein